MLSYFFVEKKGAIYVLYMCVYVYNGNIRKKRGEIENEI